MHYLRLLIVLAMAAPAAAQPVPPATEIVQDVSLQDAARAGLLQLSAKGGGISGDQVAVELTGARIAGAPVRMTFHVEFFGHDASGAPWPPAKAAEIATAVKTRLSGLVTPDAGMIELVLDFRVRDGTSPDGGTPGYHQIDLIDVPSGQTDNFTAKQPLGVPQTGNWGANEPATRWAHEVLHLAGLRDQYSALTPVYVVDGIQYPLPAYTGDKTDAAAKDAWVKNVLFPAVDALEAEHGKGEIRPSALPGHEDDIMGNPSDPNSTVTTEDLQTLIDQAGVRVHAEPGDGLVNKEGNYQNYGVALPLDLLAPRGQTVRVEGLWVFCIDLFANGPDEGQVFDVLGPLAALPYPQLPALRQLLGYLALQDLSDADTLLYGQHAVWSLTDGSSPDPQAQDILTAAGIEFDEAFFAYTPHFETPNSASANTAGVTETDVLPPIPATSGPPPATGDVEQRPRLAVAAVAPAIVRARRPARLAVLVEEAGDQLTIALERRKGKRWLPVGDVLQSAAPVGLAVIALPSLAKKGAYRVRVTGLVDTLETRFKVKKGRRASG